VAALQGVHMRTPTHKQMKAHVFELGAHNELGAHKSSKRAFASVHTCIPSLEEAKDVVNVLGNLLEGQWSAFLGTHIFRHRFGRRWALRACHRS